MRTGAVLAVAAALLGGLLLPTPPRAVAEGGRGFTPAPPAWGPCENPVLVEAGARCAFVETPLDHARPDGEKIKLAVSRKARLGPESRYQGVVVVNPGGPGAPGLLTSTVGALVPDGGGDDYDWIGFDPRGVGASRPSLSCVPDSHGYNRPAYVPTTPGVERAWRQRSREYARACGRGAGELLHHMRTTDTAKDLEVIRRALGVERINFYGFSYGTYLGQVYATLFPNRLRRTIFDGNVDPTRAWYRSNIDQSVGFDRNIDAYFDWVAEHDGVYGLGARGKDVEAAYRRQLASLAAHPAGGRIGPAELTDVFLGAAYGVHQWQPVTAAFAAWVHKGDSQPLVDLYGTPPFNDNAHAVYLAVVCTDGPWQRDYHRYRADMWRTFARAPFAAWQNAWYNAPCLTWPAAPGTPVQVDGRGVESALLINETFDAATPFSGALEVRERFPTAVLVEGAGGTTHAGSLSGVACVDNAVATYLKTGQLPPRNPTARADLTCDPVPRPTPSP
ncbi:alpha/beta fold hydrolase [Actinokineospora sp. G85]|uniref:alpha/beta fold hydrolase n=1 Tax=Actinokineospora sp. G85 TaxID=3406626 RepID=UPI003C719302